MQITPKRIILKTTQRNSNHQKTKRIHIFVVESKEEERFAMPVTTREEVVLVADDG